MKDHLGLRVILLKTNGTLVPHDPRRSHPERDAHGFVFAVVTATALVVIAATALTIVTAQVIAILTANAAIIL
jgi:hypothetical protein